MCKVRRKISQFTIHDDGVRVYSYITNLKGVTQMRHCAHQSPPSPHKNQETIGTPISNERSSRSQGTMGTPERPEVKTAFYSQISQAWQGPVKTTAVCLSVIRGAEYSGKNSRERFSPYSLFPRFYLPSYPLVVCAPNIAGWSPTWGCVLISLYFGEAIPYARGAKNYDAPMG